jgi:hypothetical protein
LRQESRDDRQHELKPLVAIQGVREVNEKLETIGDHLNDVQLDLIARLEPWSDSSLGLSKR